MLLAALMLLAVPVLAQEQGTWQPSHLADGQPSLEGYWGPALGGGFSLTNPMTGAAEFAARTGGPRLQNPSRIVDPPDGRVPYQPWAAALQNRQASAFDHPSRPEDIDTQSRCLAAGPRLFVNPTFQIIQSPGAVVFVWDDYHEYRVIPLDARPHIGSDVKLWMGDARGHWDGNTLIVDVTNLNGKSRLSVVGDFFSANAHLVERFTRVSADTMNYEVTVDDPTVFTRPWTIRVVHKRRPAEEMLETACHEGEKSSAQMLVADQDTK